MQHPVDTCRCPICGADNGCAMAARGGDPNQACWCASLRISASTLARVPRELVNKACICAACIRAGAADAEMLSLRTPACTSLKESS